MGDPVQRWGAVEPPGGSISTHYYDGNVIKLDTRHDATIYLVGRNKGALSTGSDADRVSLACILYSWRLLRPES